MNVFKYIAYAISNLIMAFAYILVTFVFKIINAKNYQKVLDFVKKIS